MDWATISQATSNEALGGWILNHVVFLGIVGATAKVIAKFIIPGDKDDKALAEFMSEVKKFMPVRSP